MKLLAFYIIGHGSGYGHMYRSNELLRRARELGHQAAAACNDHSQRYYVNGWGDIENIRHALYEYKPDWVLVDLPVNLEWVKGLAHEHGARVCLLNPVGLATSEQEYAYADLVWRQDMPQTVILRREFINARRQSYGERDWYVFGGAEDWLDIGGMFIKTMRDKSASVIKTKLTRAEYNPAPKHRVVDPGSNTLEYLRSSKQACLHCGVSAWEAACLRLPTYLFSKTEDHLATALKMQGMGLVLAWPEIGLPLDEEFREFLGRPFKPDGVRPDGKAADRLLDALEGTPYRVPEDEIVEYVEEPPRMGGSCLSCD